MNPFAGLPLAELQALRERYLRVLRGEEFEQTNSNTLAVIRHRMSHDDALRGLSNVMEILQQLDPATYGERITRTIGDHRFASDR